MLGLAECVVGVSYSETAHTHILSIDVRLNQSSGGRWKRRRARIQARRL